MITIHPEATPHIHYALQMIRELGCAAGVVINPGTPIETVEPLVDVIDLCLVMSVNPGWGGQRYIPSSTGRLTRMRGLLPPEVVLEVDGGVSLETIDEIRDAGTDLFVAGLERVRRGRSGRGIHRSGEPRPPRTHLVFSIESAKRCI